MPLDEDLCYRAVTARDPRFDGRFVTAVRTTGIYCRPSCPAVTPRRRNVEFLPTAAAAQQRGYRACLRCLPDAVPGSPDWNCRADLAARAMRLISDGVVERGGVPGLAARLGYSPRHLHRVLAAELGAGPLALARAHRAHTARLLVETTDLAVADVAFAAGFASVRQFNDTVRTVYGVPPSTLRAEAARRRRDRPAAAGALVLRLPLRPPFDGAGLLAFLAARAVPGVEAVDGMRPVPARTAGPAGPAYSADSGDFADSGNSGNSADSGNSGNSGNFADSAGPAAATTSAPTTRAARPADPADSAGAAPGYRRTLRLPHGPGTVALTLPHAVPPGPGPAGTRRRDPAATHVVATLRLADPRDLGPAVQRLRRLLDLDADPVAVDAALAADPALARSVAATPGIRLPGSADPAETAIRAVLGQQVSVAAARTAAARLAAALGERLPPALAPDPGPDLLFPTADEVAARGAQVLTGPARRVATVLGLAEALASGALVLDAGRDPDELRAELVALPGIGPWTAGYLAMRVLGDPDEPLTGDLAVRHGAAALGLPADPAGLLRHAARWQPWRSYAAQHLWRAAAASTRAARPSTASTPSTPSTAASTATTTGRRTA